jgi:predicted amidophosphoribosyltransferase
LIIENGEQIRDKKILIVDDVFTTGSTVKSMIRLLERYKPKKIQILLLSKTINLKERV